MKHEVKVTQHGLTWVDPTPPPVIICPECGGDRVSMDSFTYGSDKFYFFGLVLRRTADRNICKDCGCYFETKHNHKLRVDDWAEWFLFLTILNLFALLALLIFTNWEAPSTISQIATPISVIGCVASFLAFSANI